MKIVLTLAWRNLWRNRKRSLISMSSVLFAVLLAITFNSMERGSYERMIESMVTYSTGYVQIQDPLFEEEPSMDNALLFDEELKEVVKQLSSPVDYWVPRIQNFALVATDEVTRGIMVMGVDPEKERRMNNLTDDLITGDFVATGDDGIVLAEGLASILKVTTGDTLTLLSQGFQGATAAGRFGVKGIIRMKVPEMNNNTIYMSLPAAQWFYMAEERLTSLVLMPHDPKRSRAIVEELNSKLDSDWYRALHWEELLKDLLTLMKFDTTSTLLMMLILYVVVGFGIFGTIITMMIERQREFGMLISLGMKRSRLAMVCFFESLFISLTGAAAGMLLSVPLVLYFHHFPIRLTGEMADAIVDAGFEPVMPFSDNPQVIISQALVVLVIAFLIGLYPIRKAYTLKIIDVKR